MLDVAFAFAVINGHFDVADFLLERGANVNTDWNSHEPASLLHFLVFQPNLYEAMQYLIDRGIDMTIRDYRWSSNAAAGRASATMTRGSRSGWRTPNGAASRAKDDPPGPPPQRTCGRPCKAKLAFASRRTTIAPLVKAKNPGGSDDASAL